MNTHDVLKRWHLEFVASLSSAILIACWDTTDTEGFFQMTLEPFLKPRTKKVLLDSSLLWVIPLRPGQAAQVWSFFQLFL